MRIQLYGNDLPTIAMDGSQDVHGRKWDRTFRFRNRLGGLARRRRVIVASRMKAGREFCVPLLRMAKSFIDLCRALGEPTPAAGFALFVSKPRRQNLVRQVAAHVRLPVEEGVRPCGKQQVVGDRRDLLGFAPRLLFVQRHLEREARGLGHLADASGPGQPDLPPAPGRGELARSGSGPSLGGIGDEPMRVAVAFDLGHRFPDVVSRSPCPVDQGKDSVDGSHGIVALERVQAFP